ncbi:hypothetical protein ACP4OV_020386 [Aristida adscensionis]
MRLPAAAPETRALQPFPSPQSWPSAPPQFPFLRHPGCFESIERKCNGLPSSGPHTYTAHAHSRSVRLASLGVAVYGCLMWREAVVVELGRGGFLEEAIDKSIDDTHKIYWSLLGVRSFILCFATTLLAHLHRQLDWGCV